MGGTVRHRFAEGAPTLALALEGREVGVIGLGFAGPESPQWPTAPYAPLFARARAEGLRSLPHAGELDGPSSVWSALRELGDADTATGELTAALRTFTELGAAPAEREKTALLGPEHPAGLTEREVDEPDRPRGPRVAHPAQRTHPAGCDQQRGADHQRRESGRTSCGERRVLFHPTIVGCGRAGPGQPKGSGSGARLTALARAAVRRRRWCWRHSTS